MPPQQLRQEQRDLEGSPLVQQRRSSLSAPSPARLAGAILQADLVLVDSDARSDSAVPGLALALQCRTAAGPIGSVKLLLKGSGALARQIQLLGGQRGLALFNYPELTRALARAVPINHYVPLRLYPELSELLAELSSSRSALRKPSARQRSLTADLAT